VPIPEFILDLRAKIGHDLVWTPAVTAVVVREGEGGREVLLVQRADNHAWTPVTGVLDPGEEPAVGAVREVLEETRVTAYAERLASVSGGHWVTHVNGDEAVYLDCTFRCSYVGGEAQVGDDESVDVRWWPLDALPEMSAAMRQRIDDALSDEPGARFRREGAGETP
jgi:ADP-ribose pyrophosphatase YjhB (NUDIX family)